MYEHDAGLATTRLLIEPPVPATLSQGAAVLSLAARGWRVVPLHGVLGGGACSCAKGGSCRKPGKHPRIERWQEVATADTATVTAWWARWPGANFGVATGGGLLVLDVDPAHGGDGSLDALEKEHGPLPSTVACRTGGGGRHLYFRGPASCRNRVGFKPGLDVRADGGLVVAPPSRHASGRRYAWLAAPAVTPIAEMPPWLLDLVGPDAREGRGGADEGRALSAGELSQAEQRARAYLAKLDPAVEGRGGDKQTFKAACYLVVDFGLSPEQALPLLVEWNRTHCRPPWTEADLVHKLQEADRRPGERGRLLGWVPPPAAQAEAGPATAGPADVPFFGAVPDFVLADWWKARPQPPERRRGRPRGGAGLRWLVHLLIVVHQRNARVVIPDVLAGQVVWGADRAGWPSHWRRQIAVWLCGPPGEGEKAPAFSVGPCPVGCPLHGRGDAGHRHLTVPITNLCGEAGATVDDSFLGTLGAYSYRDGDQDRYDFTKLHISPDECLTQDEVAAFEKWVNDYWKYGRFWATYLPAWLFGPACLSPGPLRIVKALTRELTRTTGQSARPDRAFLYRGGQPSAPDGLNSLAAPPWLEKGVPYVAFNGNGGGQRRHLRGRGYRLAARMRQAGYVPPEAADVQGDQDRSCRAEADPALTGAYLADLDELAAFLGLVVGGWDEDHSRWYDLAEMIALAENERGRRRLGRLRLRVYAGADYLADWRAFFARRLGFSHIPGGRDEGAADSQAAGAGRLATAEDLHLLMHRAGVSDRELAERVGVTRQRINALRTGRRRMTPRVADRLRDALVPRPPQVG